MTEELERLTSALADRYAIERELGQGGMATVYLAEDLRLKRKVAIKVLLPDLAGVMGPKRFEREIGIVAQFNHPNILGIHDSGDVDGFLYYVMPFVEGETLRDRLDREKQLPVEDALQIAGEVAAALSYAHERDVVHRDIKPANILLEDGRAVVADFGIARAISEAGADNLTRTGTSIGTPTYMSPEQAAGSSNIDGRSDVYSLGCVAYEMLAGQPPFMGRSSLSLIAQHITTAPQPVTTFRATVPDGAAAAIERALAKSPADRFSPASKFGEALRAEAGPRGRGPSSGAPAWRKLAVGAGIVVALAVAGMVARPFLTGPGPAVPTSTGIEARYMIAAELEGSASAEDRGAVWDMVTTALGQSPALRILPPDAIARGLANSGRADTTRLTEALAVELAERGQVPAVLAGELNRVGSTYALSLRVVSPDSGTVMAAQAVAQDEDALFATVTDLAKELVAGVEGNPEAVGSIQQLEEVMTPSMAALRTYRRFGADEWLSGDVGPLEEAVAIDSLFSAAWVQMAEVYSNHGQVDSAEVVLQRALAHPERLSVSSRLYAEAMVASTKGDYPLVYELHEAAWEADGSGAPGASNVAIGLAMLGEVERGNAMMQYTYEPFGRNIGAIGNELTFAMAMGEAERGREMLDELAEEYPFAVPQAEMQYYVAFSEWSQAESVAVRVLEDPTSPDRVTPLVVEASALAARGEVDEAAARLHRASELAGGGGTWVAWLSLLSLSSGEPPPELPHDEATVEGLLAAALQAALVADAAGSEGYLTTLRALPSKELALVGSEPEVVEAVIARSNGDWDTVIATLTPMEAWTWPNYHAGGSPWLLGGVVLSLLGEAHEALGQYEAAATYYEKLASPVEAVRRYDFYGGGLPTSFARQRLVILYAALGRVDDAERHFGVFSETFTNPDPDLVYLVDEAREALAAARDGTTEPRG